MPQVLERCSGREDHADSRGWCRAIIAPADARSFRIEHRDLRSSRDGEGGSGGECGGGNLLVSKGNEA